MDSRGGFPTVAQSEMPKTSQNVEVKKEIMDPSYCPKSQYCPGFQSYLNYFPNPQKFQNYQSLQFSQNPTSEQVQPSQNISCNLFGGDEQTNTNQNGPKMQAWRVKEDVALMSAWCSVDEDRVKGRIQKGGSFWRLVHALFDKAQVENPEEIHKRNVDSLKGRFKRISANANKWIAACQKAYSQKQSGMSMKDVENEARIIYEAGGTKFQDLVVFNEVMSKHSNWALRFDHDATCVLFENEESGGSSKRARTTEDGECSLLSNPETTPSTDGSTMSGPSGDKAKQKGKSKMSKSSTTNEVAAEIRALRLVKDNEAELMRARLELEREKLKRNSMKMKEKMLNTLLAKDHLSEEDKDMKRRLVEIVFGP